MHKLIGRIIANFKKEVKFIMLPLPAISAYLRTACADMLALAPPVCECADTPAAQSCANALVRRIYSVMRTAENTGAYAALQTNIAPIPFCLSDAVVLYAAAAAEICQSANIIIVGDVPQVWTCGSRRYFATALGNIICNSILYGNEYINITIRIRKCNNYVRIIIEDNGKGMLPQTARKALVPFVCADVYNDGEKASGIGLGLSIASCYATRFSGTFALETAFGKGTKAVFSLPLCTPCTSRVLPDFISDRFGTLYTQLSPVCTLPLYF